MQEETVQPQNQQPQSTQSAQQGAPATGGGDDNLIAAVSYLWILSIIILVVKKDSDYVRFHARQGVVLFAASIVLWVLAFIPIIGLFSWILNLVILVAVIVGFIQALGGKRYQMPLVYDLSKSINL